MDPVFFAKDFWRENFCWGGSWCAWKTTTCWSMSLWRNHPDHHHAPPRIWMKLIRTSNCFFFYKKVGEMGIQSKSLCFFGIWNRFNRFQSGFEDALWMYLFFRSDEAWLGRTFWVRHSQSEPMRCEALGRFQLWKTKKPMGRKRILGLS